MTKVFSYLLLLLLSVAIDAHSQRTDAPMEQPALQKNDFIIRHTGYSLSYNMETNCPNWVAWELTEDEVNCAAVKRTNDFRGDPRVPAKHRVEAFDYKDSGFDRGHMCPAGDMKWSADAMSESFYMSNMCPQAKVLNQQWWEHLESACRRWAGREQRIYICCGPIYDKSSKASYIGKETRVRVPDGFFKVVLSLQKGKEKAIGFIYRNTNERQTMGDAATTVDAVEEITGLDFFPSLDKGTEKRVESTFNLRKWN